MRSSPGFTSRRRHSSSWSPASLPPLAEARRDCRARRVRVGTCNGTATQLFPPGAPWNQAIDAAALDAESGAIIAYLAANHTASARFQITFDFNLLFADGNTPHRAFAPTGDFFRPDCDTAPVPVPSIGRLEGEATTPAPPTATAT